MTDHKYLLRVPEAVWDELKVSASRRGRSVNSEILWRIASHADMREVPSPGLDAALEAAKAPIREVLDEPSLPGLRESFRPDFKKGGGR